MLQENAYTLTYICLALFGLSGKVSRICPASTNGCTKIIQLCYTLRGQQTTTNLPTSTKISQQLRNYANYFSNLPTFFEFANKLANLLRNFCCPC